MKREFSVWHNDVLFRTNSLLLIESREPIQKQGRAGEIENPTLDYPKLDKEQLEQRDTNLLALKEKIIDQEFPGDEKMETVKQVYRWKINEKLAEIRMLKAAASDDMRRFQKYLNLHYNSKKRCPYY